MTERKRLKKRASNKAWRIRRLQRKTCSCGSAKDQGQLYCYECIALNPKRARGKAMRKRMGLIAQAD